MSDMETAFARVRDIALARGLPGIEEGTSYGTPPCACAASRWCA